MVFREASQSFDRIKSPTQQRRRKKGAAPSPPPTVFSKAPCRPTALSSHNGILGLSSNYLRDKRSDDVEWRKITSRSHGERLLLVDEERDSTVQNRERACKQAQEKVPPRGYQRSDQRPSLGHYTCYRRLGTAHYI